MSTLSLFFFSVAQALPKSFWICAFELEQMPADEMPRVAAALRMSFATESAELCACDYATPKMMAVMTPAPARPTPTQIGVFVVSGREKCPPSEP